ncbi:MAG: hypothetical protein ABI790_07690 [Betaproteobacteria bacterium]
MNTRHLLFTCALCAVAVAEFAAAQAGTPAPPATPLAALTPPPPPAPAVVYKEGVVKVGNEFKQTLGTMTDVDKGDNGCYLTLKGAAGGELIEVGKFELCRPKSPLIGKRVQLVYSFEAIQAASCYGDPKCKKTETVPLVVDVKILD